MTDEEGTGRAPSAAPPESLEALTEEIGHARKELGETVEALVARADVPARAREKAAELAGRASDKASQVKETARQASKQAAARASSAGAAAKEQAAARMDSAAAAAPERLRRAARQAADRMGSAGAAAPERLRRAARQAASRARQRQVPLALAAGGALLAGWLIVRRRRR